MPAFSSTSLAHLASCDERLQRLFREVIKFRDCTVIVGFRDQAAQELAFHQGTSTKHWPDGEHNHQPASAVDVAAFPIDWKNRERFLYFAGFVMGVAAELGIRIRFGGDWNGNLDTRDEGLSDLVHFELIR